MEMKPNMLTSEGLKKLEDELEFLKTVRRKEVAEKIKVAMSFGDLSENSEYDEAKNEQAMVEARIIQVEALLKNVMVIDEDDISKDVVGIGSKVKVKNINLSKEMAYQIVGSSEIDPINGKISDESPVGHALMGKKKGQTAEFEAPAGIMKLKILEISK